MSADARILVLPRSSIVLDKVPAVFAGSEERCPDRVSLPSEKHSSKGCTDAVEHASRWELGLVPPKFETLKPVGQRSFIDQLPV